MTIDELLQTPYWIVDILPGQVPQGSPGQYFAVERYYPEDSRIAEIKQKHINVVLKLNCYMDVSLVCIDEDYRQEDEEDSSQQGGIINPPPKEIADAMRRQYLYVMTGDAMILSEPDDTHLTVFNPDEELLELVRNIAGGEGLFVWQPKEI